MLIFLCFKIGEDTNDVELPKTSSKTTPKTTPEKTTKTNKKGE